MVTYGMLRNLPRELHFWVAECFQHTRTALLSALTVNNLGTLELVNVSARRQMNGTPNQLDP